VARSLSGRDVLALLSVPKPDPRELWGGRQSQTQQRRFLIQGLKVLDRYSLGFWVMVIVVGALLNALCIDLLLALID